MAYERISATDIPLLRLESAEYRTEQYIDSICVDTAIQEIIDPMKDEAHQRGLAQSFIDSIHVVKTGWMSVEIVEDYINSEGKPLGLWLEKGTKPHIIRPKYPGVPGKPQELWWRKDGKWHHAKQVMHPGFVGYHLFDMLQFLYFDRYRLALIKKTNAYLEATKFK